MNSVIRRDILVGLCSVLLTTSPLGRRVVSTSKSDANRKDYTDSDLPLGCIFARRAGLSSALCKGSPPLPSIDFLTYRVSEINVNDLPLDVGRIVIWDDVFSVRGLTAHARNTIKAITRYYGFDNVSDTFGFHLDGFSEVGCVIDNLLRRNVDNRTPPRVAVIDIGSCGLTMLDWPDLLPHLKAHYDLIVGFDNFVGRGPSDWSAMSGDKADYQSRTWAILAHCDLAFLSSDGLLGFENPPDSDVRQPYLATLLYELITALSSADFVNTLTGIAGVRSFGVRLLQFQSSSQHTSTSDALVHQRRFLSEEFATIINRKVPFTFTSDNREWTPLLTPTLALWPLGRINRV